MFGEDRPHWLHWLLLLLLSCSMFSKRDTRRSPLRVSSLPNYRFGEMFLSAFTDKQEIQSRGSLWMLEFNSRLTDSSEISARPVLSPVSTECKPATPETRKLPEMLSWLSLAVDTVSPKLCLKGLSCRSALNFFKSIRLNSFVSPNQLHSLSWWLLAAAVVALFSSLSLFSIYVFIFSL